MPSSSRLVHALLAAVLTLSACGGSDGSSSASTTTSTPAKPREIATTGSEVTVSNAMELKTALADAKPGMTITLKDGMYLSEDLRDGNSDESGRFYATTAGSESARITLRGTRNAVLDGGGPSGGYGLHMTGTHYWNLVGFTVARASKGIVLDGSNHVNIDGIRVTNIGDEGVHFRSHSSDNVIQNSEVDNTGVKSPNFGEGVYIGSATSNWQKHSGGGPDRSDRNSVLNNRITDTAAENVDIKEGSSNGIIRGNYFDGAKIAGENSADSWIDVKGNGYLIENNEGVNALLDGMQVHVLKDGWGENNTFANNKIDVNADGVGIWIQNTAVDKNNVIRCNNDVKRAKAGNYATNHYQMLECMP